MWEGLLISYVTNATNVTNVFCRILSRRLSQKCSALFPAKAVPLHRISKRAEIESTN